MITTSLAADLAVIKRHQQAAWSAGDHAVVSATLTPISERLCEAADLRAGERVLDVATGSGNTAIAAARRFCRVAGVDFVPIKGRNAFTWTRESDTRWTATLRYTDAQGRPQTVVYAMHRFGRRAGPYEVDLHRLARRRWVSPRSRKITNQKRWISFKDERKEISFYE